MSDQQHLRSASCQPAEEALWNDWHRAVKTLDYHNAVTLLCTIEERRRSPTLTLANLSALIKAMSKDYILSQWVAKHIAFLATTDPSLHPRLETAVWQMFQARRRSIHYSDEEMDELRQEEEQEAYQPEIAPLLQHVLLLWLQADQALERHRVHQKLFMLAMNGLELLPELQEILSGQLADPTSAMSRFALAEWYVPPMMQISPLDLLLRAIAARCHQAVHHACYKHVYMQEQAADRLVPTLITALQEDDPQLRSEAATALTYYPTAIPYLREMLNDNRPDIRSSAFVAIGKICENNPQVFFPHETKSVCFDPAMTEWERQFGEAHMKLMDLLDEHSDRRHEVRAWITAFRTFIRRKQPKSSRDKVTMQPSDGEESYSMA
jgi:hypothetical protein